MADDLVPGEGDVAPGFRLPSSQGGEIALADFQDSAQVALFFVREFT